MSDADHPQPSDRGIDLRVLAADARTLSPEDFEDAHGDAFLLLTTSRLVDPRGPAATALQFDDDAPGDTASVTTLVHPVRRTGRGVGPFVSLGRTSNNDVVLPDHSVSRFHAFLNQTSEAWSIQDAGSTNGTKVNNVEVAAQGDGPAVALKDGDTVRIGQVELTYLSGPALRSYALSFER